MTEFPELTQHDLITLIDSRNRINFKINYQAKTQTKISGLYLVLIWGFINGDETDLYLFQTISKFH